MTTGINAMCALTVIPVRASHDDTSEIVTQLLFGEAVTIIGIHNQWIKLRIQHDDYEGWVDNKQLLKLSEETFHNLKKIKSRQTEALLELNTPWGKQNILQGSLNISTENSFKIEEKKFSWINTPPSAEIKRFSAQNILEIAHSYSNAPYLWGGRTAFGIDCSGFTQTVFHQLNFSLPRDASQQYLIGSKVAFDEQKPGDLAFFVSEKTGNIHHVGIVLPNQEIIHAHGRVRIDQLTEEGIYNENKEYYSHKLISINQYDI
ncbi:C40 family peptidase [Brumimicrobium oceani]|uniref:Hydrolase Nlp/P60 n=1 Tax=Brumimicrobium oceani TaxID=2100725 RepID=A0A2U2XH61_9FLAO|nr:NlpC/P60 family protein [Brumimicrobium oceani]PWH87051.1 hydrolase Nlp/P60 [Brumimicrobium oceani]